METARAPPRKSCLIELRSSRCSAHDDRSWTQGEHRSYCAAIILRIHAVPTNKAGRKEVPRRNQQSDFALWSGLLCILCKLQTATCICQTYFSVLIASKATLTSWRAKRQFDIPFNRILLIIWQAPRRTSWNIRAWNVQSGAFQLTVLKACKPQNIVCLKACKPQNTVKGLTVTPKAGGRVGCQKSWEALPQVFKHEQACTIRPRIVTCLTLIVS